jgi:hypothetical protein
MPDDGAMRPNHKVFFSNVGYGRHIDGSYQAHLLYAYRYLYCPPALQRKALAALKTLLHDEQPELCCFVELEQGSLNSGYFNQFQELQDQLYPFGDIANKYGPLPAKRFAPISMGKSNGFLCKRDVPFERLYMANGVKRLVYSIQYAPDVTVIFAHFSLKKSVRAHQFQEISAMVANAATDVLILGDFNIFSGVSEVQAMIDRTGLKVLGDGMLNTFRLGHMKMCLDLALATPDLARRCHVRILDQPFSDHDAVVVEWS